MCASHGVSPALSQLEIRIRSLKETQDNIHDREYSILRHEMDLEAINFDLEELRADERFNKERIKALLDEAREEGFDDKYLERFLKEHRCKLDK